ncbi:hypothetical protein VPHK469_0130 [Vibrio phage K469]
MTQSIVNRVHTNSTHRRDITLTSGRSITMAFGSREAGVDELGCVTYNLRFTVKVHNKASSTPQDKIEALTHLQSMFEFIRRDWSYTNGLVDFDNLEDVAVEEFNKINLK